MGPIEDGRWLMMTELKADVHAAAVTDGSATPLEDTFWAAEADRRLVSGQVHTSKNMVERRDSVALEEGWRTPLFQCTGALQ